MTCLPSIGSALARIVRILSADEETEDVAVHRRRIIGPQELMMKLLGWRLGAK